MSKRAMLIPMGTVSVALILLFTIRGCWTSWEGNNIAQRTDDAYVRADVTPMSTRISGTVRKVDVNDFESVKPDQLLVELDDADYRAMLEEAKAGLAGAKAELEDNQATKRIQDAKIQSAEAGVIQATAAVNAAKAGVDAVRSDVERTQSELKRQQALVASRAATHQQLEQATADADRFSGMLASRLADLDRARSAVVSSQSVLEAEKRQRTALDTKDGLFRAQIQAKEAAIVVANVNLGYTRIVAPAVGTVGERHVQEGQLVAPGMQST
jgi:membrane fusion protein (multidrug efflux system)